MEETTFQMHFLVERTIEINRDWKDLENNHAVWNCNENTTYTPYYLQPNLRNGGTFRLCLEIFKKLKL